MTEDDSSATAVLLARPEPRSPVLVGFSKKKNKTVQNHLFVRVISDCRARPPKTRERGLSFVLSDTAKSDNAFWFGRRKKNFLILLHANPAKFVCVHYICVYIYTEWSAVLETRGIFSFFSLARAEKMTRNRLSTRRKTIEKAFSRRFASARQHDVRRLLGVYVMQSRVERIWDVFFEKKKSIDVFFFFINFFTLRVRL